MDWNLEDLSGLRLWVDDDAIQIVAVIAVGRTVAISCRSFGVEANRTDIRSRGPPAKTPTDRTVVAAVVPVAKTLIPDGTYNHPIVYSGMSRGPIRKAGQSTGRRTYPDKLIEPRQAGGIDREAPADW